MEDHITQQEDVYMLNDIGERVRKNLNHQGRKVKWLLGQLDITGPTLMRRWHKDNWKVTELKKLRELDLI